MGRIKPARCRIPLPIENVDVEVLKKKLKEATLNTVPEFVVASASCVLAGNVGVMTGGKEGRNGITSSQSCNCKLIFSICATSCTACSLLRCWRGFVLETTAKGY